MWIWWFNLWPEGWVETGTYAETSPELCVVSRLYFSSWAQDYTFPSFFSSSLTRLLLRERQVWVQLSMHKERIVEYRPVYKHFFLCKRKVIIFLWNAGWIIYIPIWKQTFNWWTCCCQNFNKQNMLLNTILPDISICRLFAGRNKCWESSWVC